MKTPKEKARELVDKFKSIENFTDENEIMKPTLFFSKRCALIAVDEILNIRIITQMVSGH
jgi:hypothetical protein